jgi:hypothetical protein
MRPRRAVVTVAALAGALTLGGCGGTHSDLAATSGDTAVTGAPASQGEPSATPTKKSKPKADRPSPSLPPGDPGLDAPSVPDPGTVAAEPHGHEKARRRVPVSALLTAGTVRMALGGAWQRRPGGADECVRASGAVAARTMSYGRTDGGSISGLIAETVATYRDAQAADSAVRALGESAASCGWRVGPDPRLGSASISATEGPRSMLAVSTEGVVVLLVGTGDFTDDAVRWGSLVDLALGTSCPAAPDGCH